MDEIINKLPWELHLPNVGKKEDVVGGSFNDAFYYSFCGPGTKFDQRIAEGYAGVNHLDKLCLEHDKAYAKFKDGYGRRLADQRLADSALSLAMDPSHDPVERVYALLVGGFFHQTNMWRHLRIGNLPVPEVLKKEGHDKSHAKAILRQLMKRGRTNVNFMSTIRRLKHSVQMQQLSKVPEGVVSSLPSFYVNHLVGKRRRFRKRRQRRRRGYGYAPQA